MPATRNCPCASAIDCPDRNYPNKQSGSLFPSHWHFLQLQQMRRVRQRASKCGDRPCCRWPISLRSRSLPAGRHDVSNPPRPAEFPWAAKTGQSKPCCIERPRNLFGDMHSRHQTVPCRERSLRRCQFSSWYFQSQSIALKMAAQSNALVQAVFRGQVLLLHQLQ